MITARPKLPQISDSSQKSAGSPIPGGSLLTFADRSCLFGKLVNPWLTRPSITQLLYYLPRVVISLAIVKRSIPFCTTANSYTHLRRLRVAASSHLTFLASPHLISRLASANNAAAAATAENIISIRRVVVVAPSRSIASRNTPS